MPKSSTSWKKGVSGNPSGCPPLSPIAKAIKVRTREELCFLYEACTNLTRDELHARLMLPDITILEESFLRAMLADKECGKTTTLEKMLERIHGKTIQPIVANIGVMTLEQLVAPREQEGISHAQEKEVKEIEDESFLV